MYEYMMKIFFDESGQTGCVLQKDDLLNFRTQPTFALGALVLPTEADEKKILGKYNAFKRKYGIEGEIKGSDLLTRSRNKELDYIIKHIFDDNHFHIILYDKRFYISTLLLIGMLGFEYQQQMPEHFYQQATFLSKQKDDFFIRYLKYIEKPEIEEYKKYLEYLMNYEYKDVDIEENAFCIMAQKIVEEGIEEKCYGDFLSFGWYDNPKITNLINLNALSELIFSLKMIYGKENQEFIFIHDHIEEYEETFVSELSGYGIKVTFADSKKEELLQIVDNFVSIMRHAYDKMINHYKSKNEWQETSAWDMKLSAKLIKKIGTNNIKFTVPLCDWCAALCTEIMFDISYPSNMRNNWHFNINYSQNMYRIYQSMHQTRLPIDYIIGKLKE